MDVDLPSIAAIHLLSNFDRTFQKVGEGTSAVRWTVTGRTGSGQAFTLTRPNRFASQFDISFDSIFEMLDFLSVLQASPSRRSTSRRSPSRPPRMSCTGATGSRRCSRRPVPTGSSR